jgi:two-component system, chemotaxis family, sensor kinase CheA
VLLLDATSLPQVLGVDIAVSGQDEDAAASAAAAAQQGDQLLLFREAGGAVRAVPLAVIDRLDDVAADWLFAAAGAIFVRIDGAILPVFAADLPQGEGRVKLLRIADGDAIVCYPIDAVIDIVRRPQAIRPAAKPGLVMGTVLIADQPVEMIDCFWLMGQVGNDQLRAALTKPLCRVVGEGEGWARSFLAPILELAGYRVAVGPPKPGEEAGDILLDCAEGASPIATDMPVLRLRTTLAVQGPDDNSVYRYDRAGLMTALAAGAKGRG